MCHGPEVGHEAQAPVGNATQVRSHADGIDGPALADDRRAVPDGCGRPPSRGPSREGVAARPSVRATNSLGDRNGRPGAPVEREARPAPQGHGFEVVAHGDEGAA